MRYVASCSFGKDSLATILLARKHGEPLDEAVYCEVMFDKTISGEVPEHRDFIYTKGIPALEKMGIKVTILRSEKTYVDLFTGRVTRGPKKGMVRSFPVCGKCYVQRDCKLRPIERYRKTLPPDTVQYIGIAKDEQARLLRLGGGQKISLLEKYDFTEQDAKELCQTAGLLSPVYEFTDRGGCWFCPNAGGRSCGTSTTFTRICGIGCWNCRLYRGKYPKNLTASGAFPILTHCSVRRMPAMRQPERQHNRKGVRETSNQKYEITDIAHEKYPFLHRIRALRDIRPDIKAGDLGGFVESESNLSTELEDNAWIYDDAVVCNNGYADRGAVLRNEAIVCGNGYISHGAVVSGHSRVEDSAYVRGAVLNGHARASGCAVVRCSRERGHPPILSGHCAVYGNVSGDVWLTGSTVIISGEEIYNDTLDTLVISGQNRSVIRHPARDELAPQIPEPQQEKKQRKEVER